MSGSSGGRGDYRPPTIASKSNSGSGNGGGRAGGDACAIYNAAPLNSPRPAVVSTLDIGEVLEVRLNSSGVRPILEVHARTGIAGSLTHTGHMAIIECINDGHRYVAIVIGKTGAAVDLLVQPA
jgi:hypothetical protein